MLFNKVHCCDNYLKRLIEINKIRLEENFSVSGTARTLLPGLGALLSRPGTF